MRLLLLFTALISFQASAYESVIVKKVTSIYDADTFRVNIKGWPDIVGKSMPVRVNGIDTAEIRGKCQSEKEIAQKAKLFTKKFLESSSVIELRNIKRGKYFRLLADVYGDGKLLSAEIIAAGLARPYSGGHRDGWCSS